MTVIELYDYLSSLIENGHSNDDVRIKVEYDDITYGVTPSVDLKSVFPGFDHDNGRVILIPDQVLKPDYSEREKIPKLRKFD